MTAARVLGVLLIASAATGCAGLRGSAHDTQRLQSRVNLLEERITQLERMGGGWSSASASSPVMDEVIIPAAVEPAPAPKKKAAAPAASSAPSSVKPSTRQIQQALKNAGFYQGSVDGKSGPRTKDAISEFQRVHGLKDDGVVGKQTWTKLNAYADLSGSGGEAIAGETLK